MDSARKQIDTKDCTAETQKLHLRPKIVVMQRTFRGMFNRLGTKMKTLKTLHTVVVTGLAALSLGTAIGAQAQTAAAAAPQAQQQPHAQHGQRAERRELTPEQRAQFAAKRAERRAQRTAQLHDELAITPAQENAWKSFVASMQPAAQDGARARNGQQDRAAWAGLSAPERMAKRIALHKQRTAAMEQRLGALNSFYSVLTPEQKRTFDAKANSFQGRRGWHGEQRQG
jgi:protein CpxP